MLYAIDYWYEQGRFTALDSWNHSKEKDKDILIISYEDLIKTNSIIMFKKLYNFLDIKIPNNLLLSLITAYSFEKLTGRHKGVESHVSHLRKATSGDWKNHFDDTITSRFLDATGNLTTRLGYKDSESVN
jgi:predicted transport protein